MVLSTGKGNASNVNHIVATIHSFNQFTFNVSIVLIIAALSNLTSNVQSGTLPLLDFGPIFDYIMQLNVTTNKCENKIMFDFLVLFQSFQLLICSSAALDESLRNILFMDGNQLSLLENRLKKDIEHLNKSMRDQIVVNENASVRYICHILIYRRDKIQRCFTFSTDHSHYAGDSEPNGWC